MPRQSAADPRVKRQPLPGLLGEIERICGYAAAEKFALTFGGQEIYIPLVPTADHPIVRAVGRRAAALIGQRLGRGGAAGNHGYNVPTAEVELKWNICRRLRLAGLSRNDIVRALRRRYGMAITAGHVGQLVQGLPAPPRGGLPAPSAQSVAPPSITLPLFAYADNLVAAPR